MRVNVSRLFIFSLPVFIFKQYSEAFMIKWMRIGWPLLAAFPFVFCLSNQAFSTTGDYKEAWELRYKAGRPAVILHDQAKVLFQQGQYEEAIRLQHEALAIWERNLGSEHLDTANGLNNLGGYYSGIDEYDIALPLLQRALSIRKRSLGIEHIDTAITLLNLGVVYAKLGQFSQALETTQRALDIQEKILGPLHDETLTSRNNLAMLYISLGQSTEALPLLEQVLQLYGADHPGRIVLLNNLALLYVTLGENQKAVPLMDQVLKFNETFYGLDHPATALSLNNLAYSYGLDPIHGHEELKIELLERSLAIYEGSSRFTHKSALLPLLNLAHIYTFLGKYEKALPLYLRAYNYSQVIEVPEKLFLLHGNIAVFYARQNNPETAIFYLKAAVNTMQAIRGKSSALERSLQGSLLKKNESAYIILADLLIGEGRLAEAQQVMSMLKEEEYFDFIRRDSKADNRHTRTSYNVAEKSFADQLEKLGREGSTLVDQLTVLEKQAKSGFTSEQEAQRARIKKLLAEQSKQTVALLNVLAQQLPTIKKQQITEAIAKDSLEQLRGTLTALGHGAVLLQYLVTDKRIHIILATPQSLLSRSVEISSKELHRKIAEFRRVLENPALDPRPLSRSLYELLIAPVAEDLKQANAQTLMLSLDGSLRYLPLGVLYDGKSYLAERYPLVMYTEVAKDKLREKPEALWKVAGFGITDKIGEFPPLPSVRQELEGIVRMDSRKMSGGVLPGNIYLNKDFTQVRLKDVLDRDYSVLHIASHFKFIPGTVTQSFLLLGDGGQLSLEKLRTDGWKFGSVDMMTLSACETALGGGEDENGREIEGFGALVQRQGAKSVLATLWKVADKSTAVLMESLYRLRQERGLNKADALREAQLVLISGKHPRQPIAVQKEEDGKPLNIANAPPYIPDPAKPYAHPYFWAPFILMGNWL